MKNLISLTALSAALLSTPAFADEAQSLLIKDFIGIVNITTGDSFNVSDDKDGIHEIRDTGLIIDGNQTVDHSRCKSSGSTIRISIGKKNLFTQFGGYKNLEDYPNLDITVPEGTHLEITDSVIFGTGEDFGSIDVHIKSCGSLEIGDVNGPAELKISGSGDFAAGNMKSTNLRISGSGDAAIGDMTNAIIKVSGSGDLEGGNIIGNAKIKTTGSGDIELGALTGDIVYEGRGSSDLFLDQVNGRASINLTGSGDVEIDKGTIPELLLTSRGSSEFDFGGTAGDVTVVTSGSSEVDIDDATGEREVKTSGSAEVKIGDTRYDD